MIVNKFGGASIKDGESVQRMAQICKEHVKNGVIVVSAMGKITNLLEDIALKYFRNESCNNGLKQFSEYHNEIINKLFIETHTVKNGLKLFLLRIMKNLMKSKLQQMENSMC